MSGPPPPQSPPPPVPTERATLSRELADFLIELSIALHKHTTRRPYREAWSFDKTLGYLEERSGLEFDPDLCAAFTRMMRQWEPQVAVVSEARAPVAPAAKSAQGAL